MRTIARTSTRIITALQRDLTYASVHQGANDATGRPIDVAEAWEALSHAGARLRELDRVTGIYEIRVSSSLHYLLRRTPPGAPGRIDVVVDRDPDAFTEVTVFVDGREMSGPAIAVHVVDPGASGADHEWLESVTQHADDVPEAVRDLFDETARRYHHGVTCHDERCNPADDTTSAYAHGAGVA
ncbi:MULTISPECIES: hypothetical protein [unclassified Streptomyces]|uniref:Uncharacterized protein n=1 Tax=Streptomyces sp. F12 TaxID=1436084 RepID=V9Z6I5_9ACTN|nr:hypothetical protein [Streptomyces sp. F12]AHE40147.1 hypothetical protein pFRL6_60 [Streptomyces sp. F12]